MRYRTAGKRMLATDCSGSGVRVDGRLRRRGLHPAYSVEKLSFGAEAIFQFYGNAAENLRKQTVVGQTQNGSCTSSASKLSGTNQQNPSGTAAQAADKVRMYWCNLILQTFMN
jgi:hypothetical protein